jgi:hypothetical protein
VVALLVLAAAGAAWFFASRRAPEPKAAPVAAPRAAGTTTRARPTPLPSSLATPRPEGAATSPRLRIEADVPDASVFLDRQFLGKAPVEVDTLAPGPHRLNVSADGYEMQVRELDGEDAPRLVSIRFTEVRLDASVPVVHKHGIGSCRGTLSGRPAGLRYATDHREHAFDVPLAEASLEVDYLQKNLKVKLRGGRTLNFTHPGGEADPLFVFQRDVDKARARLAAAR